jgi:hypothetical protein
MPFTCKVGDSFYLPDFSGRHRYVILTKPNDDGKVVLVNFTDSKNVDYNIIFNPKDDGRMFKKRTTVNFAYARFMPVSALMGTNPPGWMVCQLNYIKKIVKGTIQSRHTPLEIITELVNQYPEYKQLYIPD